MSAVTDPIADYLTRIRNGMLANKRTVEIPASSMKKRLTEILYDQGYILKYRFDEDDKQGIIRIALKYDPVTKLPAIRELTRYSKPGLRKFANVNKIPRVKNGLGIAIVSTSKGLMTDKIARENNVGGEVVCFVS